MIKTLYIIEGTHPSHRFAELLGGAFGDRLPRACIGCLVQETDTWAEEPCARNLGPPADHVCWRDSFGAVPSTEKDGDT